MAEAVGRLEQEAFPPFVITAEDKRRWELVTRAVVWVYGFELGVPLSSADSALVWSVVRILFRDQSMDTGDGVISDSERDKLRAMGAL